MYNYKCGSSEVYFKEDIANDISWITRTHISHTPHAVIALKSRGAPSGVEHGRLVSIELCCDGLVRTPSTLSEMLGCRNNYFSRTIL